jgi:hypothetical protein
MLRGRMLELMVGIARGDVCIPDCRASNRDELS